MKSAHLRERFGDRVQKNRDPSPREGRARQKFANAAEFYELDSATSWQRFTSPNLGLTVRRKGEPPARDGHRMRWKTTD